MSVGSRWFERFVHPAARVYFLREPESCDPPESTKATEGAVIDRLREAVTDWRAAAETHHKTSGKAMTQQRASYYEGKGDAYNACATALERAIWEIQRGE